MRNEEMLLIPGPTPVVDSIYDAMASETRGHTDLRFVEIYKRSIERTREMLKTDGEVFVIAGSGTIGMEMALVNTVAAGERVLVISHGYFGDRFIQLGKRSELKSMSFNPNGENRSHLKKWSANCGAYIQGGDDYARGYVHWCCSRLG